MLALARMVPAADQAMKAGKWEKKRFLGNELRGKTLGIAGLGRIGQEVAQRARVVRHADRRARSVHLARNRRGASASSCCRSTSCAWRADYLTLHLPSTPETQHLFNDDRFARVKPGIRIINTARGELIDEAALRRAIESGHRRAAPASTCSRRSRRPTGRWRSSPKVVATPHIAASTEEAQELVGLDTAAAVRDFLRDGVVRNAVNFPSVQPEELQRLQPWIRLAESLAAIVVADGRGARRDDRAALLRRARRQPRRRNPRVERGGRRAAADSVGRRVDRERAIGRARARHRDHRVAQHAAAALHEPGLAQAAHERRRALGRRHGLRAEQPAAGLGARRQRRSAARRHDADHLQRRSAGRHRRSRHDSRAGTASTSPTSRSAATKPARSAWSTSTRKPSTAGALEAAVEAIRKIPAVRDVWLVG